MDALKKYWPTVQKVKKGDVVSLIIQLVILLVVCAVVSWVVLGVLSAIPVVNILCGIIGLAIDLYGLVGIILCILRFIDKF
ncbi:MAG: hypothetical protein IKB35_02335 [Clostridia bacterium]|nr:hypothetical protein [Clostridia bacterium]